MFSIRQEYLARLSPEAQVVVAGQDLKAPKAQLFGGNYE
jgi:hypothetical protein